MRHVKTNSRRLRGNSGPHVRWRAPVNSRKLISLKAHHSHRLMRSLVPFALVAAFSVMAGIVIAYAPPVTLDLLQSIITPDKTSENHLEGVAHVMDGDTILIDGTRVRLEGIDAPEATQSCKNHEDQSYPCGKTAKIHLKDLTGLALLRCKGEDLDNYGRLLATCFINDRNINAAMVQNGWAVAYRQYSHKYVFAEQTAKAEGQGLWQGRFDMPWDWREKSRQTVTMAQNCTIKGNISDRGRIYHLPGSPAYDKTRINTERGERWFCSEEEAHAAGWRTSRALSVFD